ncbi:MAG: CRTAC1 family protein [Candidatus Cloacimonetes bacterium]|nr:CRTAC1 family protein [Candidatus Cloacimonadota bacterium]
MKWFWIICFLSFSLLFAITQEDFRWLMDTEQFYLIEKYSPSWQNWLEGDKEELSLLLEYSQRAEKPELALKCNETLALKYRQLEYALRWINVADILELDNQQIEEMYTKLLQTFSLPEDKITLDYYFGKINQADFLEQILQLRGYNQIIENIARSWIDEISIEYSDSLALAMINRFEHHFPLSKWTQATYFYKLYHHLRLGQYDMMHKYIQEEGYRSAECLYISSLYTLSPDYRRNQELSSNRIILNQAIYMLDSALKDYSSEEEIRIVYELYTPEQWRNRLLLTRVKALYYSLLSQLNLYGDEENLCALINEPDNSFQQLVNEISLIRFDNNDQGELAELHYWKGRIYALINQDKYLKMAADEYTTALIYGSPRKKYDGSCLHDLEIIKNKLKIDKELYSWLRELMNYDGVIFEEYPFPDKRYSRIAIGDYDNDGYNDLLFDGHSLWHNDFGQGFTDVSDTMNVANLRSNGALWADFNRDDYLDFVTISHDAEGNGESLMKNQEGLRFVKVNERAGDIDDHYPTEGAAWIDIEGKGYPSLYCANYEQWNIRSGYPDCFWYNDYGYFSDKSQKLGFRTPKYTDNPGLAGRGVAPSDFDNDGKQEILVTNYRLNRNFCWDQKDSIFVDVAALYDLAGHYKVGYYGHSIGADWGDFDNDGDLDLFVANLAHPRFIEFSDISQLLRNDGLRYRKIESDTIWFWQFTDITKLANITYDECHSDPLWLDADNDGYLDLFITSIYENERSYLFRNNGDGTFTDITFLAGARVYNGWGNATADLNRDGLIDLVVASSSGDKILLNKTQTVNKSLFIKPVWQNDKIILIDKPTLFSQFPASPAYGTRVKLILEDADGKKRTLIRELASAKGTTSQNAQELHFGLGNATVLSIERVDYAKDKN